MTDSTEGFDGGDSGGGEVAASDGTWNDESDWQVGESELADALEEFASGPPPVVAIVGPAQRRQVDAGEPDHRDAAKLSCRTCPRRHARPGVLRGAVDGAPVHGAGHRRLGAGCQGACSRRWPSRPSVAMRTADAIILVVDCDRRFATVGRRGRCQVFCNAAASQSFLAANKVDGERGRGRRGRAVVVGAWGSRTP